MPAGLTYLLLALIGGVAMAVQAPTNAMLARASGSPVLAALISFAVGTVALIVLLMVTGAPRGLSATRGLPWYAWAGGLYGAFFVAVAAFAAPRIGVGALLTAAVAGQLAAALILDHFGLLGIEPRPATVTRMLGLLLVFAGALLVRRG
ncbi:DMT family transporter [Sphingomonas tabacisoli]|uniref:DMT family transporter n=1 Tax=Sphingomonas tabacisoli TaxID=2249466 RepID=A0ABW4I6L4_9SPHN